VPCLEREYSSRKPDPEDPGQRVAFGTSGHRVSSLRGLFTGAHILAIIQAICDYRPARSATASIASAARPTDIRMRTHAASRAP
jgi:phosphoglucomutase